MPDAILLDCSSSPYSHLKPVPINSVKLTHGFWADRLQTIQQATLLSQYDILEDTGRLNNFRRVPVGKNEPYQGYFFNDSDVYKWLEGASWSLVSGQDESLIDNINRVIQLISSAQDRDGYLNTYFTGEKVKERWSNLRDLHELYCAGHLIQAAVAHHRVTGQENLLQVAVDLADHICKRFLDTGVPATSGHPEIEMALVELYRSVRDSRYLRMAQSFLDQRGSGVIGGLAYHLDHVRFREMEQLQGHAVRAMYLCAGATDIYLETGEKLLLESVERLWERLTSGQMYVTGGIGSRYEGEALGKDYELPNARAYAETCAAIGSMMWNWRLLHTGQNAFLSSSFQPQSKYADLIEWTLYNAILPGIGLNGKEYHYVNPLEVFDSHERKPWFDCACCPTNILRLIASVAGYFYSHSEDNIWIHQYASSAFDLLLNEHLKLSFSLETNYPWDGQVELTLLSISNQYPRTDEGKISNGSVQFGINLRIPNWVQGKIPVLVNNQLWDASGVPGTYLNIFRFWHPGDKIKLEFPLPVCFLESHPFILENSGRVAISRGPLLYCIEANDNSGMDPREVCLGLDEHPTSHKLDIRSVSLVDMGLNAKARDIASHWSEHLYHGSQVSLGVNTLKNRKLFAIPYFSWGNRSKGWMQIWIKRE